MCEDKTVFKTILTGKYLAQAGGTLGRTLVNIFIC